MSVEKKNIFLTNVTEPLEYKSAPQVRDRNYPSRLDFASHAYRLSTQFEHIRQQNLSQRQVAAIKQKNGTYIQFSGQVRYELATKSLENRTAGIRLLNVQKGEDEVTRATVYVPEGKESYFLKKFNQYSSEKTAKGNPKNGDLVGSIEDVKLALLDAFWLDKKDNLPTNNKVRCEIWLRYDVKTRGKNIDKEPWKTVEKAFEDLCDGYGITVEPKSLYFPERIVKIIIANKDDLISIISSCEYVAELRKAEEPNSFFDDLSGIEQREWVDELISRVSYEKNGVSVCLIDAGINKNHPLIEPAVVESHIQSLDDAWGTDDNENYRGHGTGMSGIILYNDLKSALEKSDAISVPHELESVKILPRCGANPPDLYGAITQEAVNIAEIANPSARRVVCMAITAKDNWNEDGKPTSWSAAIDSLVSGAEEETTPKRLMVISAGNVYPNEHGESQYPNSNINHSVEIPGQAWNAITVGSYTDLVECTPPTGFNPLAKHGELSPFSSTSLSWKSQWPVKPEVLFEGGNVITNGEDYDTSFDLSLLTLGHRTNANMFSSIYGTSSATAQAAWFCAKLLDEYPDAWPETIRALMVHSSEWTESMKKQFCKDEGRKLERRNVLRTCGYGVPSLERAIQCMDNSVNMVIQGELKPFDGSSMNEMHMHKIPWPKEVLRDLGETQVKLKVTLSYFIEPSPGEVGWKDRYRYPSCGLRFEVNNSNQSYSDFKQYINIKMRGDDEKDKGDGSSGSSRWYLGQKSGRDSGSIHSDYMVCNAIDLCECNYIAVFPVGGWWKERTYLKQFRHTEVVRYSLIVTLSTPEQNVDFYTPIINQVSNVVQTTILSE